jgi:hypothetical protein
MEGVGKWRKGGVIQRNPSSSPHTHNCLTLHLFLFFGNTGLSVMKLAFSVAIDCPMLFSVLSFCFLFSYYPTSPVKPSSCVASVSWCVVLSRRYAWMPQWLLFFFFVLPSCREKEVGWRSERGHGAP